MVTPETRTVEQGGCQWTRYVTNGIDLTRGGLTWLQGPEVAWAFDAGKETAEAPIRYGLICGGKELELTDAAIRFLELPFSVPDKPQGRFQVFAYYNLSAYAYPDAALQQASADLFKAIGLTGKARFYSYGGHRTKFDALLKEQGFTLYQIALWQGPDIHAMAADPATTTKQYVEAVAGFLKP